MGNINFSWDKVIKYFKDVIIIVLFLVSISGWIKVKRNESAEAQALKSTVENNTAAMIELKNEFKSFKDFLLEQKELNGQFKEFMSNEKRKSSKP